MEKRYEKPEFRVIRYQRPVKTNAGAEFTDSKGVVHITVLCPECNQPFLTLPKDQANNLSQEEADRILREAWNAHRNAAHNGAGVTP